MLNTTSPRRYRRIAPVSFALEYLFAKIAASLAALSLALGVKTPVLVWSFIGGVAAMLLQKGPWPTRIMSGVIGVLFAISVGPIMASVLVQIMPSYATADEAKLAAGFLCGTMGKTITEGFILAAAKFKEGFPAYIERKMK